MSYLYYDYYVKRKEIQWKKLGLYAVNLEVVSDIYVLPYVRRSLNKFKEKRYYLPTYLLYNYFFGGQKLFF